MTPAIDSSAPGIPIGAANWLRHAPSGWTPRRLGHLLLRNDGGVWGEDGNETDTIVLRSTEVSAGGSWDIRNPARRRLTRAEMASGLLAKGDLVVVKSSGSELHLGKTALVSGDVAGLGCTFSNFMQRLRLDSNAEPRYAFYLLNSSLGREQLNYFGSTTTGLRNLNGAILSRLLWPGPPIEEQRVIADFLDRQIEKIDALVTKKQQLIVLLQETRTTLVSHAVTKGLHPDVPMKASGVKWLRRLPRHWSASPLMRLVPPERPIMYGIVLPGPDFPGGVPIVKGGDVSPERLVLEQLNRTDPEIEVKYVRSRLAGGDIVYAIRGSIGAAAVVPDALEGANLTQDTARVAPRTCVDVGWLMYALQSSPVFAQLEAGAVGATIRGINIFSLKRAVLPVPPQGEQVAIRQYLDVQTRRLDDLTASVRKAIDRLREYRSALIAAAVTGQIDGRTYRREAS